MKVLLVAKNDWAYVGYTLSQCLRSVGVDADMLIGNLRKNNRPGCGIHFKNVKQIKRYADNADIIQFMQGQWVETGVDLSKKRVFVFYGGTNYRTNPELVCQIFNPIVEKSIIQTGDLFGLGAKNEVWLLPAVDLDILKPNYKRESNKIIVGYFPSSSMKGPGITSVLDNLQKHFGDKFEWYTTSKKMSWAEHMKRVARCDVYIESCSLKQEYKGKFYRTGAWGVSALEAAALGNIVMGSLLDSEAYMSEYGDHKLRIVNTLSELGQELIRIFCLTDDEILRHKKETRAWIERFHSFEAVGKKLKEKVYEI